MKKVYLYYREFTLGYLTMQEDEYLWVPDVQQIDLFEKKYQWSWLRLDNKNQKLYKGVPYHYMDYLHSSSRPDLKEHAKIEKNDSDFEKLCKMAKLDFYNEDFYIKVTEND